MLIGMIDFLLFLVKINDVKPFVEFSFVLNIAVVWSNLTEVSSLATLTLFNRMQGVDVV